MSPIRRIGFFSIQVLFVFVILSNCNTKKLTTTVFQKTDEQGRLIEEWGNEMAADNDVNFRTFFSYDTLGRLAEERQYFLEDRNVSCKIVDTMRYTLVEYFYDETGRKLLMKKHFPTFDLQGRVTGHKLGYVYNYISGDEEVFQ